MKLVIAFIVGLIVGASTLMLLPEKQPLGNAASTLSTIEGAQAAYLERTGRYFQVIEYVTPDKQVGYQVIYEDGEQRISKGYGPESIERTYSTTRVAPVATSTNVQ